MKSSLIDTGGSVTLKHLVGKHETKNKFNTCAELTVKKVSQEVQNQIATINWNQKFSKFLTLAYCSTYDTEKFLS